MLQRFYCKTTRDLLNSLKLIKNNEKFAPICVFAIRASDSEGSTLKHINEGHPDI